MVKVLTVLAGCAIAFPCFTCEETEGNGSDLEVEIFCWEGGLKVTRTAQRLKEDIDDPQPVLQPESRRDDGHGSRKSATDGRSILAAIWNRSAWRQQRFNFTVDPDEHPCFAGFTSMMRDTNRCNGWRRQYPPVGGNLTFLNTGIPRESSFQLQDVVADHINVWVEEGATALHSTVAVKAAMIYANVDDVAELKPPGSRSWMEQECKVMGALPFMYSCSDRINILVQNCGGTENAWVRPSDYLVNFPRACSNQSGPNNDIVFYMCQELIDSNPNPYAAANTFAHELAHVIQGGFGNSFYPMTEGGATWLEGSLLRLAPRPMQYAWGFRSWNRINAAHLYATTKQLNARKFYQIHAMLLTYLSQEELLGEAATSALQNYQSFNGPFVPWGRASYDYFLSYLGKPVPESFEPVLMDVKSVRNPFATALLDFRVAIAAQCIVDPAQRPKQARYLMPAHLRDRPFWDCSSFQTFWSASSPAQASAGSELHYGGAAIYRLAAPAGCTISVKMAADEKVRTKILAAGTSSGKAAEVRELVPGEAAHFGDEAREIFVVQVNVDPEGETISGADRDPVWQRAECSKLFAECSGEVWTNAKNGQYANSVTSALRSPLVRVPKESNVVLSFLAWWNLEAVDDSITQTVDGCPARGYDGVQVRVHVYQNDSDGADAGAVVVLQPEGGYSTHPAGKIAVAALADPAVLEPFEAHSCAHLEGWTGTSPENNFTKQEISLALPEGSMIRMELVFASDSGVSGRGFWLNDLEIRADGELLLGNSSAWFDHAYMYSPPAGAMGKFDGVPVVVQYPEGYRADKNLEKAWLTRSAPWLAHWDANSNESEASSLRAYLGWSYSASIYNTKTAVLHPWQEACVQLQAPFRGIPSAATLFTLVDKIGITKVTLTGRSAAPPYAALASTAVSPSPSVEDPGVHRFHLGEQWPVLEAEQKFLLCVGTGEVKRLPSDGKGGKPFLHLPLTNVSTTASRELPGWTVIRGAGPANVGDNITDPWNGHTMSLRIEYVEKPGSNTGPPGRRLERTNSAFSVLV